MATITITREFTDYIDESPSLLSVHLPSSIEFEFDRGVTVGTYAVVTINGYDFKATKIKTVGNVDTYQLNGDSFVYFIGIPTLNPIDFNTLQLSINVVCKGYSSTGSLLASANHSVFKICNAISATPSEGLNLLYSLGRSVKVYHNGFFTYYNPTSNNFDYKDGSTLTGIFTENGSYINLQYIPANGITLYWLNVDGCYDSCNFTEVTTKREAKLSNSISLYSDQLINWKGYSQNVMNEVEEEITYRTIANDSDHYAQLYFMTQSPLIMNTNGELFEMSQRPAPLNPCKQNLNFTFSLKRKIYGQSY